MKKVSFVIVNYNDKVRIGRAIESCLNQTYKNIEVIVVDDGSDKETRKEYERFGDRIRLIQLERTDEHERNPSRPRNKGLEAVTGDYVCFLDSDNFFDSTFAEEMTKDIIDVSFCDWEIFGKQKLKVKIDSKWDFSKDIALNYIQHTYLDHQCLLMRTDIAKKLGYDERLARSQDCDFLIRLMKGGYQWNYVAKYLFFFEKHEDAQMKSIASIYGKVLWWLKNDINIMLFAQGYLRNPDCIIGMARAINDFETKEEWREDYLKSAWKVISDQHKEKLFEEWRE